MSRLLPFAFLIAPFIVFWAYVRFAAGYRERYGRGFYATHWYWVTLTALLGSAACYLALWAWHDHPGNELYVPPHVVNGTVVPGHFEPAKAGAGDP